MTRERYFQWIAIFEWFRRHNHTPELESLHSLLNEMWLQDRQATPADERAAYAAAYREKYREKFSIDQDPAFQKFMQDLDSGFSKKPKPPGE